MQVVCAKCSRALDYTGPCPLFCAYCGQPFVESTLQTPSASDPEAATQAPLATDQARQVPPTVGGYRIGRLLGEGGMGAVYEAEEIGTGRRVALKLIKPEFAGSADAVERFRQEGRIASRLVHPRCVFVLAVDEEAGRPYIVMELMPGATLKDLVTERGALPPDQAIAVILDVIDGLQAAHRLEVIHRDVKPSNCFLEADRRVKVGDFGLAKSLVQDGHLTKTGAFVGTPHFASPEQIRTEPIDVRTDVYSVAATLYYLLTGKPPFFGSNTAATLARIVTDPPPPLRELRPSLSPALEAVVLRGLERDRERRYPDLEAFRQALLGLVPEPLGRDGMLKRVVAFMLDSFLFVLTVGCALAAASMGATLFGSYAAAVAAMRAGGLLLFAAYFIVLERTFGGSVGKLLVGLRVCTMHTIDSPSWTAMTLRSLLFVVLLYAPETFASVFADGVPFAVVFIACPVAGAALLGCTMRARNGYRGLHEVLTGTRVVQPCKPRERAPASGAWLLSFLLNRRQTLGQSGPLPQRIGGFAIRGALKWTATDKALLGEDASLGRRVFVWLRPGSAPALDQARREVGRRTRLRWLGCGTQGDLQWDAILAPLGSPLPEFIHGEGTLAWREAHNLLEDLAGELAAALADGTLPATLTVAQVWAQHDGRAQLADLALTAVGPDDDAAGAVPQERALSLLARIAALALEGGARPAGAATGALRATLPAAARAACERLLGIGGRYDNVEQFQAALQQMGEHA
jgi:eukaryotic-like serine/threonine-protein kinase